MKLVNRLAFLSFFPLATLSAAQELILSSHAQRVGGPPRIVVVADATSDGRPDVVSVVGDARARIVVLPSVADGGFGPALESGDLDDARALVASDLDGDGRVDVAVLCAGPSSRLVLLRGDGGGRFGAWRETPLEGAVVALAAGDSDRDGRVELAVALDDGRVSFHRPGADESAIGSVELGFRPAGLAWTDLDRDGILDLVAGAPDDGAIAVLTGARSGGFADARRVATAGAGAWELADLNADGAPDLVALAARAGVLRVRLGQGAGGFGVERAFPLRASSGASSLLLADVDGDGAVDAVCAAESAAGLVLLRGDGAGGFGDAIDVPGSAGAASPQSLAAARSDEAGSSAIVALEPSEERVLVLSFRAPPAPAQIGPGAPPVRWNERPVAYLSTVPCETFGAELGVIYPWTCLAAPSGSAPATVDCATSPNQVVAAGATDSYGLSVVPARGGNHAIRLGDVAGTDGISGIERVFVVDAETTQLTYDFQLVFQKHHGPAASQPYFRVLVDYADGSGNVYTHSRTLDLDDALFTQLAPDVYARKWSCHTIDLTQAAGRQVRLRMLVADCADSQHFAYAYVDFSCDPTAVALHGLPPFCDCQPILFDGSGNTGVLNHFWSVELSDAQGNRYPSTEENQWYPGDAGVFDAQAFYTSRGRHMDCGQWYHVGLAVSTECASWASRNELIRVGCCPTISAGPDVERCADATTPTLLSVTGNISGMSFLWGEMINPTLWLGVGASQTISVSPTQTVTYRVWVTDPVSGCTGYDDVTVHVANGLTGYVTTCTCGGNTTLTMNHPSYSGPNVSYLWSPGGATTRSIDLHLGVEGPVTYTCRMRTACTGTQASADVTGAPPVSLIAATGLVPNSSIPENRVMVVWHLGIDEGDAPAYDADRWILQVWDEADTLVYEHAVTAAVDPGCATAGRFANGAIVWDGVANRSHDYAWWQLHPDIVAGELVPENVYTYKVWLSTCENSDVVHTPVNGLSEPWVFVDR